MSGYPTSARRSRMWDFASCPFHLPPRPPGRSAAVTRVVEYPHSPQVWTFRSGLRSLPVLHCIYAICSVACGRFFQGFETDLRFPAFCPLRLFSVHTNW